MIPDFDWNTFLTEPWSAYQVETTLRIVSLGFLVSAACGWIGVFLIVRRLALIGDAISHSVLPGIVVAAMLFHTLTGPWIIIGAITAGFLTSILIEWIQRQSRIKSDAAIGIVFTSMFALGVVLVSQMGSHVHLDTDCVLFGNIAEAATRDGAFGIPPNITQALIVLILTIALSLLFFKELLVSSFDPTLAKSIGIRAGWIHYGKMAWLSVVVVTAFEAVGSVIVIAMLIIPGATAMLLSQRMKTVLWLTILHTFLSAIIGYHFALWLNANVPATMVAAGLALFLLAWIFSPTQGIVPVWLARRDLSDRMARTVRN
ncbi:MAG: metal ABC transporter permease [Verrucomicrobiales bacterium]|nr:metal ABC transporter permease [Verrucomicrobiales bacterium]